MGLTVSIFCFLLLSLLFLLFSLFTRFDHLFVLNCIDDFSRCFESSRSPAWNWNFYLFPLWFMGVLIRYLILFPIRLTVLVGGFVIFAICLFFLKNSNFLTKKLKRFIETCGFLMENSDSH